MRSAILSVLYQSMFDVEFSMPPENNFRSLDLYFYRPRDIEQDCDFAGLCHVEAMRLLTSPVW